MEKFKKWYQRLNSKAQTLVWYFAMAIVIPIFIAVGTLPALLGGAGLYSKLFIAFMAMSEPVICILIIMVLIGIFKDYEMQFACGIYFGGFFVTRLLRAYIHGAALYVISYTILILICVVIWQRIKLNKKEEK